MSEPVITCPNCHSEIKLTESLAAPLIEAARKGYEERFAEKDAAVAKRETAVGDQLVQIAKERQSIEAELKAREEARIAMKEAISSISGRANVSMAVEHGKAVTVLERSLWSGRGSRCGDRIDDEFHRPTSRFSRDKVACRFR